MHKTEDKEPPKAQPLRITDSAMRSPAMKRPRFLWRGLLIVLPALAMAAFGFVSLRQDRLLVRHQAAEQAERLVSELVQTILPAAFSLNLQLPGLPALGTLAPQDDPVLGAAMEGMIAMLVDPADQLIFPPTLRWPSPEPLELDQLDSEQMQVWSVARQELFAGDDPAAAIPQFEALLEQHPPERFEALARLHLLDLALRAGRWTQAMDQLERIRQKSERIKTESGLPVRRMAEWRALRQLDTTSVAPVDMEQRLDWFCSQVVHDPGPVSEAMMEWVRQLAMETPLAKGSHVPPHRIRVGAVARAWTQSWDAHQRARELFDLLRGTTHGNFPDDPAIDPGWVDFHGRGYLILRQAAAHGTWWLGWSEDALRSQAARALSAVSVPAEFSCSIEVAGRSLTSSEQGEMRLASRTGPVGMVSSTEVTATIWLTQPELLYARQQKRTWWFGTLIAVSAGSVLGGALAAWRGFHEQQRLAELKSNFVSSVSHEMRAPIAAVRLMAEELVDHTPADPAKAGEYHGYILQECRRLSALIENVLDFSRHEQGRKQYRFQPADLARVVQETVQVMRSYATDRQLSLQHRIEGVPIQPILDPGAIQQVLVNLIDNAIKHSPPGAAVDVTLTYPPSAPDVASRNASCNNGKSHVRLAVQDRGPGIPLDEQRRIFERFYRRGSELRRETQGIGLGLAIVQYIIEAHGGCVRVESEVGRGSCFIVELPADSGPNP